MFSKKYSIINGSKSRKECPNFIWAILLSLILIYGGSIIGSVVKIPLYLILRNITLFALQNHLKRL